jgi:AcrR family transcriptional regulator
VTVAEIARAADVSEQTVFNHFPTKEDLVYWRLGSFEEELLTTIRERAAGESASSFFARIDLDVAKTILADLERLTAEDAVPEDFIDLTEEAEFSPEILDGECSA